VAENLAHRIIRGDAATLVAMQAELLGFSGGSRIVRLRESTSIAVLDFEREALVVFDGAALASLAKLELSGGTEVSASTASEV
jgi:hypothetical protein